VIIVPPSEEERARREAEMARSMAESARVLDAMGKASAEAAAASREAAANDARTQRRAVLAIGGAVVLIIATVVAYGWYGAQRGRRSAAR
jgi:ferric-dicitrate binding protein FerR (iron transport regulator)